MLLNLSKALSLLEGDAKAWSMADEIVVYVPVSLTN